MDWSWESAADEETKVLVEAAKFEDDCSSSDATRRLLVVLLLLGDDMDVSVVIGAIMVDEDEDARPDLEKRDCPADALEEIVENAGKELVEKSVSSSKREEKCMSGDGEASWSRGDDGMLRGKEFVGEEGTAQLVVVWWL